MQKRCLPGPLFDFTKTIIKPVSKQGPVRWLLAAALLTLGGCLDAQSAARPESVPFGFIATYDLHWEMENGTEPIVLDGWMSAQFGPNRTVADRDFTLHPAYVLTLEGESWDPENPWTRYPEPTRVHYLDGDLRVVRSDWDCGQFCMGNYNVDWKTQGAPAPYGLFWGTMVRYQVDGSWVTVQLQPNNGRWYLPEGTLLPLGRDQIADFWIVPSDGPAPKEFGWTLPNDPKNPYDRETTAHGKLRNMEWREPLAPIAPWPLRPWAHEDSRSYQFLPGEDDEAFRMGITFRDGYGQLLNNSAPARQADLASCAASTLTMWGGGSRVTLLGLSSDQVQFYWAAHTPNGTSRWDIEYSRSTDATHELDVLLGNPGYSSVDPGGSSSHTNSCHARNAGASLTANEMLRTAWTMGFRTGVPCAVLSSPFVLQETGRPGYVHSGSSLTAWLVTLEEENSPWSASLPRGWVTFNAEDGLPSLVFVSKEDVQDLDRAALVPREIPREEWRPIRSTGFRCVTPDYEEGPLAWPSSGPLPTGPWPLLPPTSPVPAWPSPSLAW